MRPSWQSGVAALLAVLLAGRAMAGPSEVRRGEHVASPALGRPLGFDLYLPPDLEGLARLPVIYLLHGTESTGADWLDQGALQATADRLIAAGQLPKALIVMPDAGNSWYVDAPPGAGLGAMGTAIEHDLPDWIEHHFPVRAAPGGRAVAGYSMGGFGALRFALTRPQRYAAAVVMSGAFWTSLQPDTKIEGKLAVAVGHIFAGAFGDPFDPARFVAASPLTLARDFPADAPRPALLMISGRNEVFHMREEQERMQAVLAAARIPVETELTQGDHDWDNWRAMLPRVLSFLGAHLQKGEPAATAARAPRPRAHS
jgi:enterochelin esterase family protein